MPNTRKKGAGPQPSMNGESEQTAQDDLRRTAEPWEDPLPLDDSAPVPPFPVECLPRWLAEWVTAVAEATQTPTDLGAALAVAVVAAGIAGRFRVQIRDGWQEPTNIFTVVALLPGERKSAVFSEAIAPVLRHEKLLIDLAAPIIAAAESERRILEFELKAAEQKAARAKAGESPNLDEAAKLRGDAKQLAKELAKHVVPEVPQLVCDDVTPEKLGQLLVLQGGRMFQASAEGTAFEIAKGRYSETANFDVYLKGHAGDPLRNDRISRGHEESDQPALTCGLAVQPDVIQGLAENASMRGRGFLARFLYFIPAPKVGTRKTAAVAVPPSVKAEYEGNVCSLWSLKGATVDGKPAAHVIKFSAAADLELQDFERWLEPQLAEGEDLSHLAGWANKLAGATARIAGILHMAATAAWQEPVSRETVLAAIMIGKNYLLPNAQAAFNVMGANKTTADAKALWVSICRRLGSAHRAHSASAPPTFSRRDAHNWNRRRFEKAEDLDGPLQVLMDHNFIRLLVGSGEPGRGKKSPEYEVNPAALKKMDPRAHCAQRTHSAAENE